ncbi:polyketide synthase, partial [Diplogelasinospora grovesii]
RSGATFTAAKKLVSVLTSRGVKVITPNCNITNGSNLAILLRDSEKNMPPIRGVINCVMILTNAAFTNMSFQQWSSAMEAKVNGSLNLHRFLQTKELDFFVHLSSLAGINGQMASSNYAAGCAFQDALAQLHHGVTVLDVDWMAV